MYITGTDWTAEELRSWLHVSRGNVSMNLRELLAWGVVRKLHRPGERRTLPCGNGSLDAVSENLERTKAAQLDPTLTVLDLIFRLSESEPALQDLKSRVEPLRQFFGLIDAMAIRLLSLDPREWPISASFSPTGSVAPSPEASSGQGVALC